MPSPECEAVLELLWARQQGPAASREALADRRAELDTSPLFPLPDGVTVSATSAGGVKAAWITPPEASADRCVLYLHGGGYTRGSIVSHQELAARVAAAAGGRALLVEYRLAPEHTFPAAVDDAVCAATWLLETEGVDPAGWAIAGDSAGGGLSIATMLALRDAGARLPACALLMSPWLDLRPKTLEGRAAFGRDPVVLPVDLDVSVTWYLDGQAPNAPLASPICADLAGLSPVLLQVGSEELLREDAETFARFARDAGVEVVLDVNEGLFHVFQLMAHLPETREALCRAEEFFGSHLGGGAVGRGNRPAGGREAVPPVRPPEAPAA